MDYQIFSAINNLSGHNKALDAVAIFFASFAIAVFFISLAIWWFTAKDRFVVRKRIVLAALSFILGRLILTELIRQLWPRIRPFEAHQATLLVGPDNAFSFPSGHTISVASVGMSLFFYNKKLGLWSLVLAILIGVGRIMAGLHYPTDILGGFALGILSAWVIELVFVRRADKLTVKISSWSDRLLPFTKR